MDHNDTLDDLINECLNYNIPCIKKNGQMYTRTTLLKKLNTAKMTGGGPIIDGIKDITEYNKILSNSSVGSSDPFSSNKDSTEQKPDTISRAKATVAHKDKASTASKASTVSTVSTANKGHGKVKDELLENPLGSRLDFHVDYDMEKQGRAILEDPLIQAYFNRIGVKKIKDESEIPIGLAMAVYGNHAQLGDSGLSKKLPNVLENPELQAFWDNKGIKIINPQTMIPVRFLYLV
jgi:hypothetical protein